jgi:hypothetical protein
MRPVGPNRDSIVSYSSDRSLSPGRIAKNKTNSYLGYAIDQSMDSTNSDRSGHMHLHHQQINLGISFRTTMELAATPLVVANPRCPHT